MSGHQDFLSQLPFHPPTLVDLLRWRASIQPDRLGYSFLAHEETEEASLTYSDLDRRARAIAALLQSHDARGKRVLLLYPPGLDYIAAFFGCLYAGAVAVPAYPPRFNQTILRIQAIVGEAQPAIALTTTHMLSRQESLFDLAPEIRSLMFLATDDVSLELAGAWVDPGVTGDSLAFLQYTSGSTTAPKGVMVCHHNLLHNQRIIQETFQQTGESIIVGWLPLYHDMGLIGNVLQPLYAGARCVLMPPMSFLQRPFRWLQAISHYRATTSGGPNFAYELCVRKVSPEQRATLDLSSWAVAFNGAEPVRAETLDKFAATFEECGFRKEAFYPCYGLAEATLIISGSRKAGKPVVKNFQSKELEKNSVRRAASGAEDARALVSCGGAAADHRVIIVDPNTSTLAQDDQVGEIWVSGPSVALGYWNRTKETEETFRARLSDTGEGPYLRTGDLGFIDDGEVFVTGRLKDLIIIRGMNYYPQDIEFTAERSHPALRPGCVAAFSITHCGEERLVIVCEAQQRRRPDFDAVIDSIRRAISESHDIQPYAINLLRPGSIHKTSSGKIQRHTCRDDFLSASLEPLAEWREAQIEDDRPQTREVFRPRTVEDVQDRLVSRLAAKLQIPSSRVDVNGSPIRYGLDSLNAVGLVHEIETDLGVTLPMASFLQDSTIAQLAAQIFAHANDNGFEIDSASHRKTPATEYELSHGQRALWFLNQVAPASPAYIIASPLRLLGELDLGMLRSAFHSLVERHACLRTTIDSLNGEPVQRVHDHIENYFTLEDASGLSWDSFKNRLLEESQRPFDLERGPLFRVLLFERSREEHVLLLAIHHIVADLWSLGLLTHELGVLYLAEKEGERAALAPLPLQYADYVDWQARSLRSAEGERLWAYWQRQLAGELPPLDLPTDRARPRLQTYRGASQSIKISADLSSRLKSFSRDNNATLYMTLLAAFQSLLYRYTNQEQIIIGSPTAGRSRAEFSGLVGYFVNPLALRADLSADPSFVDLLKQVRRTVLAAFEHQDFPFATIVERLQIERDLSRPPLVQVMFALQKGHLLEQQDLALFALGEEGARVKFGDLVFESVALQQQVAQFDLTLMVAESGEGLTASLQYNSDLFYDGTASRMLEEFRTLLEGIATDPQQRISRLPILAKGELDQLLFAWNDTAAPSAQDARAHELFEAQAEKTPDAVAVTCNGHSLTYRELNRQANRMAHHLRSLDVGPEVVVAICLPRSSEMVMSALSVLKSGGAYLPLDPTYPAPRLNFMLKDSRAHALVTRREFAGLFDDTGVKVVCIDEDRTIIDRQGDSNPPSNVTRDSLAYVIYTSGSTGGPKGVEVQHKGLSNLVAWHGQAYAVSAKDRATQLAGLSFDASVWELWPYLAAGASIHIPDDETRASVAKLIDWLASEQITICFLPTPLAEALLAQEITSPLALRALLTGGDKLHRHPQKNLPFTLVNHYGPTEDSVVTTRFEVAASASNGTAPPIGRPIANKQVYIFDSRLQPVPPGVSGELYIGGVGLARGYRNLPELTADKFVPNPFSPEPGAHLYKTGDLARYLPDGNIEFLGRIDHQVKVRGFRIELGEIETMLSQHELVREAAVIAREDSPGYKRLIAYVVPKSARPLKAGDLRDHLKKSLPDYMLPATFVMLDALPCTPNGKIDRKALPLPDQTQFQEAALAPRNPIEALLAGIWTRVLGLEQVSINDNFFELGGHSLLATQIISRVRSAFEIDIPLHILFESPTIASLAEAVEKALGASQAAHARSIEPASRNSELPLSSAQQRLWFLSNLESGNPFYNIPAAMRVDGLLDAAALGRSLNEIVKRHETLRTTFAEIQGKPLQIISPLLSLPLPVGDLSNLSRPHAEEEARRLAAEEARHPFDLAQGPLLRVLLLRLAEDAHVIVVNMHHIISDGWSTGVFIREMAAIYEALSNGKPSPLPDLKIQYADFACWQQQQLQSGQLQSGLAYWRDQLAGAPVLELPTDRPRPSIETHRGATQPFFLGAEIRDSLKSLSVNENSTLFMTLLAAFKVLLHRHSMQDDISVGTPIAGRNLVETEELIGFFVNTLVLRSRFSNKMSFRQLLALEREVAVNAYLHQDVPFEAIVEEVRPERHLSHSPLFQVMFALQSDGSQSPSLPGLRLSLLEIDTDTAKFDMLLSIEEAEEGLKGKVEYNTDLFDSTTIDRFIHHFRQLLAALIADPDQPIFSLPMLTSDERQLLLAWNHTQSDFPCSHLIHDAFQHQARLTPDCVAVERDHLSVSYHQLNARANQLAHHLIERGAGPETLVAVFFNRSTDLLVAVLGVLKSGAAYVPIDPAYPAERVAFMLEDSKAHLVITQQELAGRLPTRDAALISLDDEWEQISRQSQQDPARRATPANLAYVIYTSGSTGKPKGVGIQHRSVVAFIEWSKEVFGAEELRRVLASTSVCFDLSVFEMMAPLSSGGTVVLVDNVLDMSEAGERAGVSLINTVPSAMRELVGLGAIPESVKVVNLAGEPLSKKLVEQVYDSSRVERVWNLYGPTEDTTYSTAEKVRRGAEEVTIGRPIANTKVHIVDGQQQEVPVGVVGRIYLSGEGLARGYMRRGGLTAERFVPNALSGVSGERMYDTGDLGRYRVDGSIEYVGRADHQVKVRGYRIELEEVEGRLREQEGVREAVVVVKEGRGGEKEMVGYVVSDEEVEEGEVRRRLREVLPEYMVVRRVERIEEMPRLPNGKVDRGELGRRKDERRGGGGASVGREKRRASNEVEEKVAGIWKEVLGLEEVGVDEDFFELGGHSLLAARVASKLRSRFQIELPLRTLFEAGTVAGIARAITAASEEQVKPAEPSITALPREKFAAKKVLSASELSGILRKRNHS